MTQTRHAPAPSQEMAERERLEIIREAMDAAGKLQNVGLEGFREVAGCDPDGRFCVLIDAQGRGVRYE